MAYDPAEDRRRHNEWVDELASDIEWEPLRDFILRLKEPVMEPMDDSGWIEWTGGECPVDFPHRVDVKVRFGTVTKNVLAAKYRWTHIGDNTDIVAYRPVMPAPKQYRPFASAEEFRPFRDRWINCKDHSGVRVSGYTQIGVSVDGEFVSWSELFERFQFEDGSPCGMEVSK